MDPVDPISLNIPDYGEYIKYPMDLKTVTSKLQEGKYEGDLKRFVRDIRQIFMNAVIYNEPMTDVYSCAVKLSTMFENYLKKSTIPIPFPLSLGRSTRWVGSPLGWKRAEV